MYFLAVLHSYKNKILASIVMFSLLVLPFCQAAEKIQSGQPLKILLNTQKQYEPQNLLFELDNMDVTRLVRFEEKIAWIHPAALLNQGSHYVKVYRFFKNELQLLQQYDFDIVATDSSSDANILQVDKRSSTLNIDNSINASMTALTSDKDLVTKQRWTLDGSSTINAEWAGNGWALDAETNLFFDKNNPANDTPFMTLDDYLINVKRGQLSTRIGHHRTEESNLVLQNFHRRGLSMQWASENKDKRFTGFVFNSKRIAGFRYGLGISNKKSRVIGGVFTLKPFESYQQTEFSATWLTGKNQQEYMMLDEQGHALAFSFKSQHLNERLTLQGDVARSVFDDGMGGMDMDMEASKPKTDKAYRSSIKYHAIQADEDNKHSLSFNFENRYVGASFYSLANLGLSSDVRSTRLSMNYKKKGLSLQASVEQQRDNVNHDPMQATVDSLQLETSIDFSPENTKAMHNNFWGKPHFSLRLSSAQENSISLPMGAIAMDKHLSTAVLSADFRHKTWDWGARFSYDKLEEDTGHVETTYNQILDIAINHQLSESSQLSAQWQMYKSRALGVDDSIERLLIVSGSTELIPKKLTANSNLTLTRKEQTWDSIAKLRASTLEFGLNYIPKIKQNKKFKYNLWLKGQYHKQNDILNSMNSRETYQVSTGLTMTF